MLLEPIKITLHDKETLKEFRQRVITFEFLLAAVQLEEALGDLPEQRRLWWWQPAIKQDRRQIDAVLELVVAFFWYQFTVQELRTGADPGTALAVIRSIVGRAGKIFAANPYRDVSAAPEALGDGGCSNWLLDLQCMLIENFHFSPTDLAQADIDILLPFVAYYPHRKSPSSRQVQEDRVYADQAPWL